MSRWSVFTCATASTGGPGYASVERFAGTFATEALAMEYVRRIGRHCRVREEPYDVVLNEDGTRMTP